MNIQEQYPLGEYTEEDLAEGEEYQDKRREHRRVREILEKHSWKIIRDFNNSLPCPQPNYLLEILPREYNLEQLAIKKNREAHPDEDRSYVEHYTPEYIKYHSYEDFCRRWHKFNKLKTFIF